MKDSLCFTLHVYPKKGERFYFNVRIFHNKRAMRLYYDAMSVPNKLKPLEKFEAVTCPRIYYKDLDNMMPESDLGEILFYRPMTGCGIVSHEMLHAALHWMRVREENLQIASNEESEELLALTVGSLTRQFFIKY